MLVHVVADYGGGDLAFAEVCQRLKMHIPEATLHVTPVPAFDTVSAGFCVAQLALTEGPDERVVFHNVAPRADTPDPRPGNQGERLVCAELAGRVLVMGPNSGHTFSFIRDEALSLREVPVGDVGSQFRSRDFFPELLARILRGDGRLGDQIAADAVAAIPQRCIVYVDGYGNLKTSWFAAPVGNGERVEITIGGQRALATVTDGTFEVPMGELAFAPGSSGWTTRSGEALRFFEVFLRGGSAARRFGSPSAGAPVEVRAPSPLSM